MTYHEDIRDKLNSHVQYLENIGKTNVLPEKILGHFNRTLEVLKAIDSRKPENYRMLIEYLNQEGRNFGWSFAEKSDEEKCETDFWRLKDSIKTLVQGMSVNERLYFFGYLDEYENLKSNQQSARDEIELKLFMK